MNKGIKKIKINRKIYYATKFGVAVSEKQAEKWLKKWGKNDE